VSVVECFELTELVEYNSVDWWFFSTLASDDDTNKITNIIPKKWLKKRKAK